MDKIVPFLDSLALIQGIVIGLIIIALGKRRLAPLFFGLFLITYSIELGDSIMMDFHMINQDNEILHYLPLNFYFLNIALLYLYLEAIVGRFSWKKHIWWLLPGLMEFAVFSTMSVFYPSFSSEFKVGLIGWYTNVAIIFYICTSIYIIYRAYRYQRIINETHTGQSTSNIKWIIYICIYFIIYSLVFLFHHDSSLAYIILSTINVLFIYIIGILGLKQKYVEIGDSIDEPSTKDDESQWVDPGVLNENDNNQIEELSPSTQLIEAAVVRESLFDTIDIRVKENQNYLDTELSLFKLSRSLKLQSRKLSETILESTGLNFKKYINRLRIEHAKSLIVDENNANLTMTALAYDSGFQSKSTFYSAFKENVGVTPTEYRSSQG